MDESKYKHKNNNVRSLYLNDRLKERMSNLLKFPCTVVEAPMGYGKTTAVKETLKLFPQVKAIWQNIYEGGISDFWFTFCNACSLIDQEFVDGLRRMGIPTNAVFRQEIVSMIHDLNLSEHIFLIIDDYHFVKSDKVDEFLEHFLRNLPENLHIVIITRLEFLENTQELQLKGFINHIGVEAFEFSQLDIKKYYRLCGINITEEEQKTLYSRSEGWVCALYLFMLEHMKSGNLVETIDIQKLVYQTVYLPLKEELKNLLNYLSPFDAFCLKQAEYVWGKANTERLLNELILHNAFIAQNRNTGEYHFHNIFTICIREETAKISENKQKKIYQRAGEWYLYKKEYFIAMDCFYKAKDYNNMLSAFEKDSNYRTENEYKMRLLNYMYECPENIKKTHHNAMLRFVRRLFALNEYELFLEVREKALKDIKEDLTLDEVARNKLLGEYEIVSCITAYNDITKMMEHSKNACLLLETSSTVLGNSFNWTFGSPSILYMFYRESGKLSEHLEYLKEAIPYYSKATAGHGSGAEYGMEAELYYMRGDYDNAMISIYKAISKAKGKEQWGVVLCANFLKAKIAMVKGDFTVIENLFTDMCGNIKKDNSYSLLETLEVCEAYLYIMISKQEKVADWIKKGDFADTKILFPALSSLHMLYGRVLLEQREYLKLIGLSEMFLQTASTYPHLLSFIYINIYLAGAYNKIGKYEQALECLKKALERAEPDKLYMPFVENGMYIGILLWESRYYHEYDDMVIRCKELYEVYLSGITRIKKECAQAEHLLALTERELEIARLAALGLSNHDISLQLYVTENTVKAHLKSIFCKLSIKSRAQLTLSTSSNDKSNHKILPNG